MRQGHGLGRLWSPSQRATDLLCDYWVWKGDEMTRLKGISTAGWFVQ